MKHLLFLLALLGTLNTYAQVPNYIDTTNLKGWWSFTGNANDSSNGGNNLTNNGGVTFSTDRFGKTNSSAEFNGNGRYFSISNPNLPSGNAERSVSVWYNQVSAGSQNQGIFIQWGGISASCNTSFAMFLQDTSRYYFAGRCKDVSWHEPRPLQVWVHLVLVYKSDSIFLYKNDSLVNSISTPAYYHINGLNTSLSEFAIGNGFGNNGITDQPFNGRIDDLAFWGRAISRCEISKLYHSTENLILNQPKNDIVSIGDSAQFSITDTGGTATYQWQENVGSGFVSLNNGGVYSGVTTKNMTIKPVSKSMDSNQYRCVRIGNPCIDTSEIALLIIDTTLIPKYVDTNCLLGYWPFTGNAKDISGNGYHGIVRGASLTVDRFGKANSSYRFSGDTISTSCPGVQGSSDRTIAFWYNPDNGNTITDEWFMVGYGGGISGYASGFDCNMLDNKPGIDGSASYAFYKSVSTSNWHFYAITYSSSFGTSVTSPKVYIDDTLQTSPTLTLGTSYVINTGSNNSLRFGANGNPVNDFNGNIDDIGVWCRVLTDCELTKLYYSINSLIVTQPDDSTIITGNSVTFSIKDTGAAATYQWQESSGSGFTNLANGGIYSGVTTKTLTINPATIAMTGYRYRCVRTGSKCIDTSGSAALTVNSPASVSNTEIQDQILVVPNPTKNEINIISPIKIEKVELINMMGQILDITTSNSQKARINLDTYSSGIYFIRVNNVYMKKVLKQ